MTVKFFAENSQEIARALTIRFLGFRFNLENEPANNDNQRVLPKGGAKWPKSGGQKIFAGC
jgi:hypothetical protein